MAETTGIEWADSTLNFWIGCTRVSPACGDESGGGCYAEALMSGRLGRVEWGPHAERVRTKTWGDADRWQRQAPAFRAAHGRRRRVFVNSLSDFFDNHRSVTWRADAWEIFRRCPDVVFMLLTKRPQNIARMLPDDWGDEGYPNVWIGATVENQTEADRRVPHLLAVPAVVRFLSCEPLLGEVNLTLMAGAALRPAHRLEPGTYNALAGSWWPAVGDAAFEADTAETGLPRIHWIIGGGESGDRARPTFPPHAYRLRDDCAAEGVPFLWKQWGEWAPTAGPVREGDIVLAEGHGFVRTGYTMRRVGKKAAGRLLQGVQHDGIPAA